MYLNDGVKIDNCAAIILAAGGSNRLGKPKQLLAHKGKSLLKNAISVAAESGLHPIIVVLGSDATLIGREINEKNVSVVYNEDWNEGIASSIRSGVRSLDKIDPASDAAILLVCDQPYITSSLITDLLTTQRNTGKPMVAAYYGGVTGTPALFYKDFFPELIQLEGDKGAARILREQPGLVATVSFPLGTVDIDTVGDYEKLKREV